jgi:hypothetical protein
MTAGSELKLKCGGLIDLTVATIALSDSDFGGARKTI